MNSSKVQSTNTISKKPADPATPTSKVTGESNQTNAALEHIHNKE